MKFRYTINFFIFTSLLFNHISLVAQIPSDNATDMIEEYVYKLQYISAENLAKVLMSFVNDTDDVRITIQANQSDPTDRKILIKAGKEDYLKILKFIEKLDAKPPKIKMTPYFSLREEDRLKLLKIIEEELELYAEHPKENTDDSLFAPQPLLSNVNP